MDAEHATTALSTLRWPGPGRNSETAANSSLAIWQGNDQDVNVYEQTPSPIIAKIEDILEDVIDALCERRPMTMRLRSRLSGNDVNVTFPSSASSGARRFTAVLQVLYICHEALVAGTIITKRHIYYQNPPLFGNQAYVDRLIDDIAFTFGVGRDALNVVAASKGLIAGAQFDCDPESHRVAIPPARNVGDLDLRSVKWVLIIEKEAIFHGLAATRYYKKSAAGDGIIVTAKGYPDLATRQFLHSLHCMHPQLPIHALVDFDPDGIAIMRTFKHGSQALKHEADVLVPGLRWLGVRSSDVFDQYNTENADLEVANMSAGLTQREETRFARRYRSLSCLTAQDRIKGIRILNSLGDQGSHGAYEMEVARELQFMLMLNLKFEIQAVNGDTTLMVWLDKCLLISHAGGPGGR